MADKKDRWLLALAEQLAEAWDEERSAKRSAGAEASAVSPATATSPTLKAAGHPSTGQAGDQLAPECGTSPEPADRAPADRAATPGGDQVGPRSCEECRHWRPPESLVAKALEIMPMRTMANSEAVREAERTESSQIAEEVLSHPAHVDEAMQMPREARNAVADARPMAFAYCGEHEMEGRFELLEIKNADGDCESFTPNGSVQRACETCAFYQAPTTELLALVQEPFTDAGTMGTQLFQESVQKPLKARADLELDEVLRKQGFVTGAPVHFPYCKRLYNAGAITLIGPLANRGRQCESWSAAKAAEPAPWQKALAQVETLRRKLATFSANAPRGPAAKNVEWIIQGQEQVMSKDIDDAKLPFVAAALEAMGFQPDEARSVVNVLAVAQEQEQHRG